MPADEVGGGHEVDLRREFSNSCTSAKSLVRRLLRRIGKGANGAQESLVTVFEEGRGPNVRVLRQVQRRLAPTELEALGKTRPGMTEAQRDEAGLVYRDGWTRHNVGQRLGVADQTIRRVLVERAVTIRPGGRRKVVAVA